MTHQSRLWLTASMGGRWSLDDMREALPDIPYNAVRYAAWQMANSGSLHRFDDGRYGVTSGCMVPRGVRVEDVIKAVTA